jgi:UDP-N-acetylmuramate dehydrogenase
VKIPAAWLVEHAGFPRGFHSGNAGVSRHHALALVNRGGTSEELLALAEAIEKAVRVRFGIELVREPVIVR